MTSPPSRTVVCIGGALVDRKYLLRPPVAAASSNPAVVAVSFGGVARNVADNLARLGAPVRLAAAVGRDAAGDALLGALATLGADVALTERMEDAPTAEYAAMLDASTGEMLIAAVAMDHAERRMEQRIGEVLRALPADAIVFADANLSAPTLMAVAAHCRSAGVSLALDAVSIAKSARLPADLTGVDLLVLNSDEAAAISGRSAAPEAQGAALRERGAAAVVVTAGSAGAALSDAAGTMLQPALPVAAIDVTGAGDSLIATLLWRMARGETPRQGLRWAVAAAGLTTETAATVRPDLSADFLEATLSRMPAA